MSSHHQNQNGIMAMLDEECLRPGTVTDETFLDKLNTICAEHQHFESRLSKNSKFLNDHSLPHSCFRIQHYAGKVPGRRPARATFPLVIAFLNDTKQTSNVRCIFITRQLWGIYDS